MRNVSFFYFHIKHVQKSMLEKPQISLGSRLRWDNYKSNDLIHKKKKGTFGARTFV